MLSKYVRFKDPEPSSGKGDDTFHCVIVLWGAIIEFSLRKGSISL